MLNHTIENIDVSTLKISDSRFFIHFLHNLSTGFSTGFTSSEENNQNSHQDLDFIVPPVIFRDSKKHNHLLHGFDTLLDVKNLQRKTISAVVLPSDVSVEKLYLFMLTGLKTTPLTAVQQGAIIHHLLEKEPFSRQEIITTFLPVLGFESHDSVLRKILKISALPSALLHFAHDRKISLKQLHYLTRFPQDLLITFSTYLPRLHLTASSCIEILEYVVDDCRKNNITATHYFAQPFLQEILQSDNSPNGRTVALKQGLIKKVKPMLTKLNDDIQHAIQSLHLPPHITVDWDRSLEEKQLTVSFKSTQEKQLAETISLLQDPLILKTLTQILSKL